MSEAPDPFDAATVQAFRDIAQARYLEEVAQELERVPTPEEVRLRAALWAFEMAERPARLN
jgi:hypothetical protein